MAQPFEQVLESLRGLADQKLKVLEEKSATFLTELKGTIEARVESEKKKVRGKKSQPKRATRGRRAAKKAQPALPTVSEVEEEENDKENTPLSNDESSEHSGAAKKSSAQRQTRRSSRRNAASAPPLSDTTSETAAAENAKTTTKRSSTKRSTRTSKKSEGGVAATPSTGGRMTRARARQQAQVLETIVETTENDDTSPEQSPMNEEVKKEVTKKSRKTKQATAKAVKDREEEKEKEKEASAADLNKERVESAAEKKVEEEREDAKAVELEATEAQDIAGEKATDKSAKATTAKSSRRKRKESASASAAEDEKLLEEASEEKEATKPPVSRRASTRQRKMSAAAAKKSESADASEKSAAKDAAGTVEESLQDKTGKTKSPEKSKNEDLLNNATDAKDSKKEEEEELAKKPVQAQKKRGRARTKPRQRAQGQKEVAEAMADEEESEKQEKKKARMSNEKHEKRKSAEAKKASSPEPTRNSRRRTRSSRVMPAKAVAPEVERQEPTSDRPQDAVKETAPEIPIAKTVEADSKAEAVVVTPESNRPEQAPSLVTPAPESIMTTPKPEDSKTPNEQAQLIPEKQLNREDLLASAEKGPASGGMVKSIASKLEGKIMETRRISEVLQAEAASTKKAVEAAKSGGLRSVLSLLSPDNEDGAKDAKTQSRLQQMNQEGELQNGDASNSQSFVQKATNVISSVTSFLPAMKKDQQSLKSRKPVEVKALKAAEAARRQEAAKQEEKLKRREIMKDRAIAAREAKQRLEEQKRRQLLIDQQKKGEQMKKRNEEAARKKRERDDLIKKERDDKRRKMELELKNRKLAEEKAAQKFTMGAGATSKQHPSGYKGLHMKDHKESSHMNKSLKPVSASASHPSKATSEVPRSNFNAKAKPFSASNRMPNYGGEVAKAEFKQPSQSMKPFSAKENTLNKGGPFREQVVQKATQMNVLYSSSAQNQNVLRENNNKENAAAFSFSSKAINSIVQKTPELKMMQQQQQRIHQQENQTPVMRFHKPKSSLQSYQMTPYRSDSEESDDEGRPAKPVPQWAKSKNLSKQLQQQMKADPDEIFKAHATSCSLDDVFKTGKPKPCYKRRGSSGNWLEDRMTWKEEWFYKKAMGYL